MMMLCILIHIKFNWYKKCKVVFFNAHNLILPRDLFFLCFVDEICMGNFLDLLWVLILLDIEIA